MFSKQSFNQNGEINGLVHPTLNGTLTPFPWPACSPETWRCRTGLRTSTAPRNFFTPFGLEDPTNHRTSDGWDPRNHSQFRWTMSDSDGHFQCPWSSYGMPLFATSLSPKHIHLCSSTRKLRRNFSKAAGDSVHSSVTYLESIHNIRHVDRSPLCHAPEGKRVADIQLVCSLVSFWQCACLLFDRHQERYLELISPKRSSIFQAASMMLRRAIIEPR